MRSHRETLGAFIRRERMEREIGLREMAKMIGVSPTYLSKVERDEFSPPAEDKVKAIAKIIGCDPDDLLARAAACPPMSRTSSSVAQWNWRRFCGPPKAWRPTPSPA